MSTAELTGIFAVRFPDEDGVGRGVAYEAAGMGDDTDMSSAPGRGRAVG